MEKIDVHSHFLPPFYRQALLAAGYARIDGMPALPEWSIEDHIKLMDHQNIKHSILSISSPGTSFQSTPERWVTLTRKCNEYGASMKKKHPDRISFWASLPMPLINESLEEFDRAMAAGASGVVFLTNYRGRYLGDPIFQPIFAELNKRSCKIFIHPTVPCTLGYTRPDFAPIEDVIGQSVPQGNVYPVPMMEFFFDTARAASNLLLRGCVRDNSSLTFILPHAAGALPPLLSRLAMFSTMLPHAFSPHHGVVPADESQMREWLNTRFYFDLAGAVFPGQLRGMLQMMDVQPSRLLYGSDYPFTFDLGVAMLADAMLEGLTELFGEDTTRKILSGNARELLQLRN